MSEKKIIRTALDPIPSGVIKDDRDYSKEPYFVKKLEMAEEFIEKNGLPKSFTERKK